MYIYDKTSLRECCVFPVGGAPAQQVTQPAHVHLDPKEMKRSYTLFPDSYKFQDTLIDIFSIIAKTINPGKLSRAMIVGK